MATQRRPTRSMQRPGTGAQGRATGRSRVPSGSKSNTGLIIGGAVGGGVLLIVIIAVVASRGGGSPNRPADPGGKARPEPVDVGQLVAEGERCCEEGHHIIQSCKGQIDAGSNLSAAQKTDLKGKLQKGIDLIEKGMNYLDQARQKSGENVGEAKREWGMSRKLALNYVQNLGN